VTPAPGVDLHTHTTASDGTCTPEALVGEARERGLGVLAITDHDSTEAVEPARRAAGDGPPLTIVPGIEINTEGPAGEVHVLGFFVDHLASWLGTFLAECRAERAARVHRIAERLASLGLRVDPAEVLALVREGSPGRPHVAQVLLQKGYVRSVKEAFDRYLGAGKPGYVAHRKVEPREACAIIHRAGGLAVLAHPSFLKTSEVLARELAAEGLLDGIECYYPEHTPAETDRYLALCRELGLVPTGGSDFHGPPVRTAELGQPPVPWSVYEALCRRAGQPLP
jgi:hypothetical protein